MSTQVQYASLADAVVGTDAPQEIIDALAIIDVAYYDMFGRVQVGQLVVASELAAEVQQIFVEMFQLNYRLSSVTPIISFGWNDFLSMAADNTSGFNYRVVSGTDQLSNHSFGRAIDINPRRNPYIGRNGIEPPNAVYRPFEDRYVLHADHPVVLLFESYGWTWLGHPELTDYPDYQHFQKPS